MSIRTAAISLAVALAAWAVGPIGAGAQTDHYQCYKIKDVKNPPFAQLKVKDGNGVTLTDQMSSATVDVKKVRKLCMPVSKDGGAISDPSTHYCEYQVKGVKFAKPRPVVEISSQFQVSQLEIKKAFTLMVPCSKLFM